MGAMHHGPEKDHFYFTVGNAIRRAREASGMSGHELAKAAGISHTAVAHAEQGITVSALSLAKIAHALDTTLDELVPTKAVR